MHPIPSYRSFTLAVKAALVSDVRSCFDDIVVENDHGAVVLSGALPEMELAQEAEAIASDVSGAQVVNHIVVVTSRH